MAGLELVPLISCELEGNLVRLAEGKGGTSIESHDVSEERCEDLTARRLDA